MTASAAPQANILTIQQLSKKFGNRFAVDQATWSATSGQIICLLGHSGCGKTTMLRLIAGLETPSSGSIQLEKDTLWDSQQHIAAEQRNIGLVFQDYALFPHLSVHSGSHNHRSVSSQYRSREQIIAAPRCQPRHQIGGRRCYNNRIR